MSAIDWLAVVAFFLLITALGWSKRSKAASMKDYAVASGSLGTIAAFASLSSSYIGPGFTLGLAEKAYEHGVVYLLVFMGFSMQTVLVGLFVAPRLHRYSDALTLGDVIDKHFGKLAKMLTGLLSFLYCAGIAGIVAKAAGSIVSGLSGIPTWVGATAVTVVVLIYSVRGGMRAVVSTDVVQFAVMVGGALAVLWGALHIAGPDIPSNLPSTHLELVGDMPALAVAGLFVGFLLGETLVPPYAMRSLITREPRQAGIAFAGSAVFSVAWFAMMVGIGLAARAAMPNAGGDGIFVTVALETLGPGALGLVAATIVAIVMSTQDSFLNSASVALTRDVLTPLGVLKHGDDANQLTWSRVAATFVGTLGVLFALVIPNLVDGLLAVYTLWAPTVVIPLLVALITGWKHPTAAVWAIIAGGATAALWEWGLETPWDVPSLIPGILANVGALAIVRILDPRR